MVWLVICSHKCYTIFEVRCCGSTAVRYIFFGGVFVSGGTIFVIFSFAMAIKQYKRDIARKKEVARRDNTPIEPEHAIVAIKATVVDQTCCVKTIGIKPPKTVKEFIVAFQTANGDFLKLNIPEEMYDGFEQGQKGILSIIDGELYGFELEENVGSMP